ncbi:MAG: nucleoside-diphosphate kinase [Armatimonadota bacterium]
MHERIERTLAILKPEALDMGLVERIASRLKKTGLKVTELRIAQPKRETVAMHYAQAREKHGDVIWKRLCDQMTSAPGIVLVVLQGWDAVAKVRAAAGEHPDPLECRFGTIRRDYAKDNLAAADLRKETVRNLIHTSDSVDTAEAELQLWDETIKGGYCL